MNLDDKLLKLEIAHKLADDLIRSEQRFRDSALAKSLPVVKSFLKMNSQIKCKPSPFASPASPEWVLYNK